MFAYHYGIAVGINHYPGVSDLSGPVYDATDFHDWLADPDGGGLPGSNLSLTTTPTVGVPFADAFDARPIKREIDRALELINKRAQDDIDDDPDRWNASRLYIYVAGHGIMPGEGETALLLADARAGMYENIELRAYLDWYRKRGVCREVVVFADCCRNWFGQVIPSAVPFTKPPRPAGQVFALVGYAAGPGDPAYEDTEQETPPDKRRGYFTRALIDGLRGSASEDSAYDAITSTTLAGYVAAAVAEATRDKPVPQHVEMPSDPGHPIVFGKVPAQPGFRVTIRFPAGWSAPVELIGPNGKRTAYDPAVGPWTQNLHAGLYAVVRPGTYDTSPFSSDDPFMVSGGARDIQL